MIYILFGSMFLYVYAAYQHMRICHNDSCNTVRLAHVMRFMVFIGLSFFLYDAAPAALFITSAYVIVTVIIWFSDDMKMLKSDAELTSGVATDYRRLVRGSNKIRRDAT